MQSGNYKYELKIYERNVKLKKINIFLLQIESTIFLILFAFGKVSEKVGRAQSDLAE